jgi:transcriptional regulator with XRE-family HTH domain
MNTQLPDQQQATPTQDAYDPNKLLDELSADMQVEDDTALARALELSRPQIGQIRHGKLRIGATILLRMQEFSGIPIKKLKTLLGDKRSKYRFGGS